MKIVFIFIFSILLFQRHFAQVKNSLVSYNGIDSFLIDAPKTKFGKNITLVPGGKQIGENKLYITYQYHKDSLVPMSIAGIKFRHLLMNFEGDSILSDFNVTNIYGCKLCKDSLAKRPEDFQKIKNYLETTFKKKGKFKQLHLTKTFIHYAYEWHKRAIAVKVIIQYDLPYPTYGYAVDLVFATKYSPLW